MSAGVVGLVSGERGKATVPEALAVGASFLLSSGRSNNKRNSRVPLLEVIPPIEDDSVVACPHHNDEMMNRSQGVRKGANVVQTREKKIG